MQPPHHTEIAAMKKLFYFILFFFLNTKVCYYSFSKFHEAHSAITISAKGTLYNQETTSFLKSSFSSICTSYSVDRNLLLYHTI